MCGICGFVSDSILAHGNDQLNKMVQILEHRGPDDRGTFWKSPSECIVNNCAQSLAYRCPSVVGLGHARLSIIDLSKAGQQPMSNEDGRLWITYNGEIYNFRAIRDELVRKGHQFRSQTDTEVVLHAYEEWGADCLKRFNGMFAFAIYDMKDDSVFIARDRLGIKPLYWCQTQGRLAFASEVKSLFQLSWVPRCVDAEALLGYLLFLWSPEPRTSFLGVEKLPAGHWLLWKAGKVHLESYWDIAIQEDGSDLGEDVYLEQLDGLLQQAVQKRMLSDVPVGVFLSGGLDSSVIAACMSQISEQPVSAYTIAFDEQDKSFEAMPDDQLFAKKVASHIQADYREIKIRPDIVNLLPKMLWHLEEPIADPAAINTYLLCQMAKERGTTVMLSGMGADEIFAGYRKHLSVCLAQHYRSIVPEMVHKHLVLPAVNALPVAGKQGGYKLFRWLSRFAKSASLSNLNCFIGNYAYYNEEEIAALLKPKWQLPWVNMYPIRRHQDYFEDVAQRDLVAQMTYLDTKLFLPGLNLAYTDKASMAASVEVRVPFVDHDMVSFALNLPSQYRLKKLTQKYLLKKVAQKYLPKDIVYRPKAPFGAPLRAWMHRELSPMVERLLSKESIERRGYFNYEFVQKIIADNQSGKRDYGHRLWGLLTFEIWHRIFIDDDLGVGDFTLDK